MDGSELASVLEPFDQRKAIKRLIIPTECGHFQILHVAPRSLPMDQFCFIETVYRLSEGFILRVADTAY